MYFSTGLKGPLRIMVPYLQRRLLRGLLYSLAAFNRLGHGRFIAVVIPPRAAAVLPVCLIGLPGNGAGGSQPLALLDGLCGNLTDHR